MRLMIINYYYVYGSVCTCHDSITICILNVCTRKMGNIFKKKNVRKEERKNNEKKIKKSVASVNHHYLQRTEICHENFVFIL